MGTLSTDHHVEWVAGVRRWKSGVISSEQVENFVQVRNHFRIMENACNLIQIVREVVGFMIGPYRVGTYVS
ncbi:18369_t:CDS:2 [Rhizophagus irregularis]|nr:18369_t:CDS:2 [Rhizophagus irregularis]